MTKNAIQEEQFGFRKGRSTTQAVRCLQEDKADATRHPGGKLHAVFIDYTKAFNLFNRTLVMEKVVGIVGNSHITQLLRSILERNFIEIDDTVSKSEPIKQSDPLSPLLFIIATAEIPKTIAMQDVKIYIYADDMVLVLQKSENLETAFNKLAEWAVRNDPSLNETKTV